MSRTVDNRVVDMQFNNAQFESGIKDSMDSIERLKKGLNFDESTKSFSNLTSAANAVSFAGIADGVETIASRFTTLGIIGVTALQNITNSAINLGKTIIKKVLDPLMEGGKSRALNIEQAKFQFAGLGMDIEATMEDANYAVSGTAYSLDAAAKVASQLGASGMRAGEQMRTSLRAISGVAAMAGSSYEDIGNVFTKVAGQGRLMGDDLLRLSSRGINAAATIAKSLNLTESEVRDMVTKGKIDFAIFSDAMDQAFGEHATAANKTFTGSLSNMRAALSRIGEKVYTPLHQNLITPLNELRVVINEVNAALSPTLDSLATFMVGAGIKLSENLRNMGTGWDQFIGKGIHDSKLFQDTIISVAESHGIEARRFIDNGGSFVESLKLRWVNSAILGEALEELTESTKGLTDEQITELGYTRDQIDALEELNRQVKDGTVNLDEWSKKLQRQSATRNIVDGLVNSFKLLGQILAPLKNAFLEIFPPASLDQIYDITERFKKLTSTFKMGEETANNLKNTFKGFFAVIDIGVSFVKALGKGLVDLVKAFAPAGSGILGFTGNIGELLVYLRDVIKQSGIFNQVIGTIVDVLKPVGGAVSWLADLISKLFSSLTNFKPANVAKFSDGFKPLKSMADMLNSAFEGLKNVLRGLSPLFDKVVESAGIAFSAIKDGLSSIFSGDNKFLTYAAGGGAIAAIFATLKDLIFNIKLFISDISLFDNVKRLFGNINGVLGNLSVTLRQYQETLRAKTLMEIAKAVALLAAAVLVLSTIDPTKLAASLGALTVMFADLMGAMALFQLLSNPAGLKGVFKATTIMIAMSAALLLLSFAVKTLSSVDYESLKNGLGATMMLILAITLATKALSSAEGKLLKGATGLVIFASAIVVLTSAVKKLGSLNLADLTKGLVGVGLTIGILKWFVTTTDMSSATIGSATGILVLSSAIVVLASAVRKFSELEPEKMIQGLLGLGTVLVGLMEFLNRTGSSKMSISSAIGLTILAASMHIYAAAVSKFGEMDTASMIQGLLGMGAVLGILIVTLSKIDATSIMAKSAALLVISAAMIGLSKALDKMGGLSWEQLATALMAMAGSLVMLSWALDSMKGALSGSAALLVAAAAIGVLAVSLKVLSTIPLSGLIISLLAIGGALGLLGALAPVMAPFVGVMLGIAGAVTLLGAAMLAAGAGFALFAAGIASLAVVGAAGAASLIAVVEGLLSLIPMALEKIGEGILAFSQIIIDGAPKLATAAYVLISSLVGALVATIPMVVEGVGQLLLGILEKIAEYSPKIAATGLQLVTDLLLAIAEKLPALVDAGILLMVAFINGMADGIRDNSEVIFAAVKNLLSSIIEFALDALFEFGGVLFSFNPVMKEGMETLKLTIRETLAPESMEEIGSDAAQGIADGLTSKSGAINQAGKDVAEDGIDGMTAGASSAPKAGSIFGEDFIAGLVDKKSEATKAGESVTAGAIDGVTSNSEGFQEIGEKYGLDFSSYLGKTDKKADDAGVTVSTAAEDGIKANAKEFENAGSDAGEGFTKGLSSWEGKARDAAIALGEKTLIALQSYFEIESPSKVTRDEVGRYVVEGIAEGITASTSAEEAAQKKAQNIVNAFKAEFDRADLRSSTASLEHQLWQVLSGSTAGVNETTARELNLLQQRITNQTEKTEMAKAQYEIMLENLGADSDDTRKTYNEYLQAQIDLGKLMNELEGLKITSRESTRDAYLEYVNFMTEYSEKLLEMGYSMEEIEAAARRDSGYEPDQQMFTQMENAVEKSVVGAMDTVQTVYENSATQTFGALTSDFSRWGADYATSIGDGFIRGFNTALERIKAALDAFEKEVTDRVERIAIKIENVLSAGETNSPVIRPVVDLTDVENAKDAIDSMLNDDPTSSSNTKSQIAKVHGVIRGSADSQTNDSGVNQGSKSASNTYIQNNYSPKPLSRIDIYRQTKNLISASKGPVTT